MIKTFSQSIAEDLFSNGAHGIASRDAVRGMDMVDAALSSADLRGSFGRRMRLLDGRGGDWCDIAMRGGRLLRFRFEDGNAYDMGFAESARERARGPKRQMTVVARRPTHPGEALREELMPGHGLTVAGLANRLGVSRQSANELIRERRALSTDMALRLARLFGTSAEFWLNLQRGVDLWDLLDLRRDDLNTIEGLAEGGCLEASTSERDLRVCALLPF